MTIYHPGTGKAHDTPDFLPHFFLVTVDGTFGTGGFLITKGTSIQALMSIIQELLTIDAQIFFRMMVFGAKQTDHHFNNFFLLFYFSCFRRQWHHPFHYNSFSYGGKIMNFFEYEKLKAVDINVT